MGTVSPLNTELVERAAQTFVDALREHLSPGRRPATAPAAAVARSLAETAAIARGDSSLYGVLNLNPLVDLLAATLYKPHDEPITLDDFWQDVMNALVPESE